MADDERRARCPVCARWHPLRETRSAAVAVCNDCAALATAVPPDDEDLLSVTAVDPRRQLLLDLVDACERVIHSAEGHDDVAYRQLGQAVARATSTWRHAQPSRLPVAREVFQVLSVIAADVAALGDDDEDLDDAARAARRRPR